MSQIVGVIPSRWASTRFPGKPLTMIAGKKMIQWVVEGAKSSQLLSEVWVATDDQRIAEAAEAAGARSIMTSSDLPSGSDRVWAAAQNIDCDLIINIQGDEPLIRGATIDLLIKEMLSHPRCEMGTLAHQLMPEDLGSPSVVKVIINQLGEAIYFSRLPIPFSCRKPQASSPLRGVYRHIGMYAYRKAFLHNYCAQGPVWLEKEENLEQLRALDMGARILVVPTHDMSWGVDTPMDVEKIEKILAGKK